MSRAIVMSESLELLSFSDTLEIFDVDALGPSSDGLWNQNGESIFHKRHITEELSLRYYYRRDKH